MADDEEFVPGKRVCIEGIGTAAGVHEHGVVERLTKTQIIIKGDRGGTWRYTRNETPRRSIPYSEWGGSRISRRCQKPKEE